MIRMMNFHHMMVLMMSNYFHFLEHMSFQKNMKNLLLVLKSMMNYLRMMALVMSILVLVRMSMLQMVHLMVGMILNRMKMLHLVGMMKNDQMIVVLNHYLMYFF
jgi:hypothetical protein